MPRIYKHAMLLLAVLLTGKTTASGADLDKVPPQQQHKIPAGYKFHDYIEFTNRLNGGRPHLHLDQTVESAAEPEEGWHTLLITPDGRVYRKPITESLAELEGTGGVDQLFPGLERDPSSLPDSESDQTISRRQLRQFGLVYPIVPPSASIGVSTSSGDLSCNGCGPDNRVQVTPTTTYPFMTVGQLVGQLGSSSVGLECTGTLIGSTHVLTAAHCVFDINASRRMVADLNFSPAQNGNSEPYGTLRWTQARIVTQFSSQPSYTTTAMNYDFALITLASPATSGYLGLAFPAANGIQTVSLTTAGYPGSKPQGTMWQSACGNTAIDYSSNNAFANVAQCARGGCGNILTHTCISSDGQSGSAIWDTDNQIRAVLTGKVTTSDGNAYNVATEIDTEVYNQIASWYNEDGDNAGNGTLPLAPSGPGAQPAKQNSFVRWWNENWGKSWFIAVVVFVGLAVLGFGFLLIVSILRCCGCFERTKSSRAKPQASSSGYPVAANATGVSSRAGLPPRPPQPLRPEGVTYDGGSGQFIVNGRPYGQYQGYQHGRTPSTAPLVR